jgi:hypothetical protein
MFRVEDYPRGNDARPGSAMLWDPSLWNRPRIGAPWTMISGWHVELLVPEVQRLGRATKIVPHSVGRLAHAGAGWLPGQLTLGHAGGEG